jgi:DNA-directed RNA polymerase specialized sigma24 family protein
VDTISDDIPAPLPVFWGRWLGSAREGDGHLSPCCAEPLAQGLYPLAFDGQTTGLTKRPVASLLGLVASECDDNPGPKALLDIGPNQDDPVPSSDAEQFTTFVIDAQPRLLRALVGYFGVDDAHDAMADAFVYTWEHWKRVSRMDNPTGYVYRVAISRGRRRWHKNGTLSVATDTGMPDVEPALPSAMRQLSPRQRTAVFLVHGCQWSQEEVADLMGISVSSVRNHLTRGMTHLRHLIGDTEEEKVT